MTSLLYSLTIDAGCGGINMFNGAMSYLNQKEIEMALREIASASSAYAFLLAIETISPSTANLMKELQSWANQINAVNINSCEAAQALVGGYWPKKTESVQQMCRFHKNKNGYLSDWVKARQNCAQVDNIRTTKKELKQEYPLELTGNYNIVYEALKLKNSDIITDVEEVKKIISLTGTLIVRDEKEREVQLLESQIDQEGFLDALLWGSIKDDGKVYNNINLYTPVSLGGKRPTDNPVGEDWLNMTLVETTVYKPWTENILEMLTGIQYNILHDEGLSPEQKKFVDSCSLPIFRVLNVLTAFREGECPIEVAHYAKVLAMDVFIQKIKDVIDLVKGGCYELRRNQQGSTIDIDDYLNELKRVEIKTARFAEKNKVTNSEFIELLYKVTMLEDSIKERIVF